MSRTLAVLLLTICSAACSSTTNLEGEGGSGGAGQGGGETGGGEPGDVGEALDLFACGGVEPDCVQDSGHLGEALTDEAVRCGGELATSGEAGALLTMSQPGPFPTETETLYVLDGIGSAFVQTRSRCAADGECADQNTAAWRRTVLQRCTIDVPAQDVAGCDADGPCAWYGQVATCEVVPESWTCGEL